LVRLVKPALSGSFHVDENDVRLNVTLPCLLHKFGQLVQNHRRPRSNPLGKELMPGIRGLIGSLGSLI
jgi:hypothetical protein